MLKFGGCLAGGKFVHLGPRAIFLGRTIRRRGPMKTHGVPLQTAPIKCPDFSAGQGAVVNADFVNLAAEERVHDRIVRSGSYHKVLVGRCAACIQVKGFAVFKFAV